MNIQEYREAYKELLSRLKNCGNLTTVQRFDEMTGEPNLVRDFHLIQIIEDYMCDILEDASSTKKGCGRKFNFGWTCSDDGLENHKLCDDCKSTKNGMPDKKPHADVFIERAGNLTRDGTKAIRAVCGTDEEYSKYVEESTLSAPSEMKSEP